jgi:hypothetical protein
VVVVRLAALATVTFAACTPDVPSGVYYCGPERACPPDLVCDDSTAVCVLEDEAEGFACGEDATLPEPDDTLALATDYGARGCGFQPVTSEGCLDHPADVDHVAFTSSLDCDVRPFEAKVRYPVAFAPVVLELLDDAGEVLATGEVCVELDATGQAHACIETDLPEDTAHVLRMRRVDGSPDCDGTCRYNRYQLSIQ